MQGDGEEGGDDSLMVAGSAGFAGPLVLVAQDALWSGRMEKLLMVARSAGFVDPLVLVAQDASVPENT